MNAKMLSLYRQAHIPSTAVDPSNNMPYETTIFSAEKFAELIVEECANIAKKEQGFNAKYSDASEHPQVNIDQCILMEFGL